MRRYTFALMLVAIAGADAGFSAPVSLPVADFKETSATVAALPDNDDDRDHRSYAEMSGILMGALASKGFARDIESGYSKRAPVRGVLAGDLGQKPAFPRLYVYGLIPGDKRLCFTLTSPNGDYVGTGSVIVTPEAAAAGSARLILPTFRTDRQTLPAGATAALVRVSDTDRGCRSTDAILPAAWSAQRQTPVQAQAMISGIDTARKLQLRVDGTTRGALCETIVDTALAGPRYRLRCPIPDAIAPGCQSQFYVLEAVDDGTSTASPAKFGWVTVRTGCSAS